MEILVTLGIVAIILAVLLPSLEGSKSSGSDLEVKRQLAGAQVELEKYEVVPGVSDYITAFVDKDIVGKLSLLSASSGVSGSQYEYKVSKNEFAIVFPLKKESSYYCVDSLGNSKEVSGLLATTGPINCTNANRVPLVIIDEGDGMGGGGSTGGVGICSYPAPPFGCSYIQGSSYNPSNNCGMTLTCGPLSD